MHRPPQEELRAAIGFLLSHEPLAAEYCAEVLRIPVKRATNREIACLKADEVAVILSKPDLCHH
jgi:hypothetical protein